VLREHGVDDRLLISVLQATKALYSCSEVFVPVGGVKSQAFIVGVGHRQGSVLLPLLFIGYMNWIDSQVDEGVTVECCKINRLLFADDLYC